MTGPVAWMTHHMTDLDKTDLLPCPFCGNTNVQMVTIKDEDGDVLHAVGCPKCGCNGAPHIAAMDDPRPAAAATWNQRAEFPRIAELESEVARLQTAVDKQQAALKDVSAMHLLMLAADNNEAATEMVGRHNMQSAAWRMRTVCELPLDQSHDQIMSKLRDALTLAFGEPATQKEVQP